MSVLEEVVKEVAEVMELSMIDARLDARARAASSVKLKHQPQMRPKRLMSTPLSELFFQRGTRRRRSTRPPQRWPKLADLKNKEARKEVVMSSFFTLPASQRKRKRTDANATPLAARRPNKSAPPAKRRREERDESISGSDSEESGSPAPADEVSATSASDDENETAAEKRLRLAERYLENIRSEIDTEGFDAADLDRDLIADRLKEDVAEAKGKIYRRLADELDFQDAEHTFFRANQHSFTGVAVKEPYAYTVSKDGAIIKWELSKPEHCIKQSDGPRPTNVAHRKRPKQMKFTKGDRKRGRDQKYQHHTGAILCCVISPDGRFLATGGDDKRLIIWDPSTLEPLKVFGQHRDKVVSLAFRRGTNQLFSASADRTIKIFSLNEMAYVETLFGHQDTICDIDALSDERCLSVGSRDRTARLWKVLDESQLVFRGGSGGPKKPRKGDPPEEVLPPERRRYDEGSLERIAQLDSQTFVTGSDNGSLSLWSIAKKKPLHVYPLAHGLDPPPTGEEYYADADAKGKEVKVPWRPRWITALKALPYTDLFLSGSWDGAIRVWRVSKDTRKIEPMGTMGRTHNEGEEADPLASLKAAYEEHDSGSSVTLNGDTTPEQARLVKGVINDIDVFERGDRGKDGLCVVVATGKEHRMGRWLKQPGKNGAVVFEVKKKPPEAITDGTNGIAEGVKVATDVA